MGKMVGIDLGTTNSAIAYMTTIRPKIIENSEGQLTTPSIVSWQENGDIYVGELAKNQAILYPKTTVRSIKRYIGMKDKKEEIYGMEFTPEEISAIILKKLIKDAEASIGKITNVVISVPAYFRDGERKATKAAASIVGFKEDDIEIVNEPNAAAMSYALENPDINDVKILVFDLGGGTFDVTILDICDRICNVVDNGGVRRLGGDDFDDRIINYLIEEFKKEHNIDLNENTKAIQLLKTNAERAKIRLSNTTTTKIIIGHIIQDLNIDKELTRDKFNELTKDIVEKTKDITKETLSHAKIKSNEIDKIIMVGGSSRISAVQNAVKEIFPGKDIGKGIFLHEPDLAIAKGAAIYASIIFDPKTEEEIRIKNSILNIVGPGEVVSTHDLGVAAIINGNQGFFSRIIKKGTPLPTKNTETYRTSRDNQTSVNIDVYEGEKDIAEENQSWSKFNVADIPANPKGTEKIDVTFEYAADNTLRIIVKILSTGKITEKFINSQISDNKLAIMKKTFETGIQYLK